MQTAHLKLESHYQVPESFIGQIEPQRQTDLGFEAGGTLVEILVEEGDTAEKGDLLAAKINEGLQIDVWMQRARQALSDFDAQLPASIDAELVFDQSEYTSRRLREVGRNMLIGMSLILSVLLLTLGVRAAMIVALVLPLVSLATCSGRGPPTGW